MGPDKPVKVDVRCDVGNFVGIFTANSWELLVPHQMSPPDYVSARRRLRGLSTTTRPVPVDMWRAAHALGTQRECVDVETMVMEVMLKFLNLHVVQGAGIAELFFAAVCRRGLSEEKVLITVDIDLSR
jgi:hypothetical protein